MENKVWPYQNFSPEPIMEEVNEEMYLEGWMPISGYEKYYMVSSFGRVKSVRENIIMKQYKNEKGYLTIGFQSDNVRKKFKVHRLVAAAYIPNPQNKPEINHDDFIKVNNHFINLLWSTGKENTNHAQQGGKRPIAKPKILVGEYPKRCQKVINTETNSIYESVFHLAEELKLTPKHIRKKLSREIPNDTPYEWLKGQFTIFYPKRYESDVKRYLELKPIIYGTPLQ